MCTIFSQWKHPTLTNSREAPKQLWRREWSTITTELYLDLVHEVEAKCFPRRVCRGLGIDKIVFLQLSKEFPLHNLKYFVKREAKLNQSIQEEKLCYCLNISCINLYLWASTWFSVLRRNIFEVGLSKYRHLDQSSAFSLTLYTLISVSIFSILFTIHFL